jgi:general secretion pathway protein K
VRRRSLERRHQHGVAVITALLLTTLAITLVASLFWQQQVQVRSIENQRLQLQKQWILRGALDWARLILREDARSSRTDNLDEPWAVPLAETRLDQYVENGNPDDVSDSTLSGSISDAQARYNLTNLCPAGTIVPREVAAFGRLLTTLHLNPALAQATADMMAATKQKPASSSGTAPQPMQIAQVEDLLAVPGFSSEMLGILRDFVAVLPGVTTVNVNTAPIEVLAARIEKLSLADAATIVASRKQAYFRDLPDFNQRFPGKPLAEAGSDLSVATGYFFVNGTVRLNRASLELQSLIERTGLNTKVIWIREN